MPRSASSPEVTVTYAGSRFTLVNCNFFPGAEATLTDPPEQATLEYDGIFLAVDAAKDTDLTDLLAVSTREAIENLAIEEMTGEKI